MHSPTHNNGTTLVTKHWLMALKYRPFNRLYSSLRHFSSAPDFILRVKNRKELIMIINGDYNESVMVHWLSATISTLWRRSLPFSKSLTSQQRTWRPSHRQASIISLRSAEQVFSMRSNNTRWERVCMRVCVGVWASCVMNWDRYESNLGNYY